jgi:hypothetical protein
MFTSSSRFSIVAISVLGLAGWSALGQDGQQSHDGPVPGPAVSPSAPGSSPAASNPVQFVLLSDGRIVKGVVAEEESMVVVTQPVGSMKFPKKRVERVFDSMQEVYAYKLEQLPENDFDERIKLARWCLAQKLEPEARKQLEAVLQSSPKHVQAKAMLDSLDQSLARAAARGRDPAVQQTGGEAVQPAAGDRPGALDASVISGARRGMGVSDLPVVFDLPRSQAAKRADEFSRYVHPVLQNYCARCHNERYDGPFQLVQYKSRSDRTPAALRANLDASLKLVDRENPARSDLLSSALRPHGRGPNPRPIFKGSNDAAYQILATWVNKLQSAKTAEGVVPAGFIPPASDQNESFASQRGRISNDSENVAATRRFVTGPVENKTLPPMRAVPGHREPVPETAVDPNDFPVPFAVGGGRPKAESSSQNPRSRGRSVADAARSPENKPAGGVPSAAPAKATSGAGTVVTATSEADVEAAVDPESDQGRAKASDATKKKPKKTLNLDPTLLQRALQLRNQNRQTGSN